MAIWLVPRTVVGGTFTTSFSGAPENPISENGKWKHTPNQWAFIETRTGPNRAVGTQTGSDGFNDSYAYLEGFGPNVELIATIYKDPTIDTTPGAHEVELLVRVADTGSTVRAYEANWSSTGDYQQIVRWNGPLGNFNELANTQFWTAPVTDDKVRLTIVGSTITAFIKRVGDSGYTQMSQATDSVWSSGAPGIGMWLDQAVLIAGQPKFGFKDLTVNQL
jgi:hypothetical protein